MKKPDPQLSGRIQDLKTRADKVYKKLHLLRKEMQKHPSLTPFSDGIIRPLINEADRIRGKTMEQVKFPAEDWERTGRVRWVKAETEWCCQRWVQGGRWIREDEWGFWGWCGTGLYVDGMPTCEWERIFSLWCPFE